MNEIIKPDKPSNWPKIVLVVCVLVFLCWGSLLYWVQNEFVDTYFDQQLSKNSGPNFQYQFFVVNSLITEAEDARAEALLWERQEIIEFDNFLWPYYYSRSKNVTCSPVLINDVFKIWTHDNDGGFLLPIFSYPGPYGDYGNQEPPIEDFYVRVEARRVSGPDDSKYGLLFRSSGSANDRAGVGYYIFRMNDIGQYEIYLRYDGEWEFLHEGSKLTPPGVGYAFHELAVIGLGSDFYFFIDQEFVAKVSNNRLSEGVVGVVSSFNEIGNESIIEFKDIELYVPPEAQD